MAAGLAVLVALLGLVSVAAAPVWAATKPTVVKLSVNSGPIAGGTLVTVSGKGFGRGTAVLFGAARATKVTVSSGTNLTATAPRHAAGTVDVTVTTPGGKSARVTADRFTYVARPVIRRVTPASGGTGGGTKVTISGSDFRSVTKVTFGGTSATAVKATSATTLTATAPKHAAGRTDVVVSTRYGSSAAVTADRYTYVSPPAVTAVSPATGPVRGGTTVTVTGSDLTAARKVVFGTAVGTRVTVASPTRLTVTAPPGTAGTAEVRVTTDYGTSAVVAADRYLYVAPGPVTDAAVDGLTLDSATLSWTNPHDAGFRGVVVRRATGTVPPATPTSGTLAVRTSGAVNQWSDTGLARGTSYSYALFADDGDAFGTAAPAVVTVAVPSVPSITGTVTGAGRPLAGVTVRAVSQAGTETAHVVTGADGSYAFAGLPAAGSYTLCFDPAGGSTGPGGYGFLPRCWYDAPDDGTATPVSVPKGGTVSDVDADLPTAGSISGTVRAGGAPLPGTTVTVDAPGGEPVADTTTDASGHWAAAGLPAGTYTVCFDPSSATGSASSGGSSAVAYGARCYDDRAPDAAPTPVTVTAADAVAGVDITLPAVQGAAAHPAAQRSSLAGAVPSVSSASASQSASPAGAVSSADLAQQPCADVLFLAARGSGESGPGGVRDDPSDSDAGVGGPVHTAYQEFVARISDGRTVTPPVSVSYPADNVVPNVATLSYIHDLWQGVAEARRALALRAGQCPNERIVLAGYSQGAMVMHRVLRDSTTSGVPPIAAGILDRVDATILIGDGDRVAHDTTRDLGTAGVRAQGVGTQLDATIHPGTLPSATGAGTFSVCDDGDTVCDFRVPYLCAACAVYHDLDGIHIHRGYDGSRVVRDAADQAAAREQAIPAVGGAALPITGTVGTPVQRQFSAIGPANGPGPTWAVAPGSRLPSGLTLDASGLLTGTPTQATVQAADLTLAFTAPAGGRPSPITLHTRVSIAAPAAQHWTASPAPLPADAASGTGATLDGDPTCLPHGPCWVTGSYTTTDGGYMLLIEEWSGAGWTAMRTPLPAGADTSYLYGGLISCADDGTCAFPVVYGSVVGPRHSVMETLLDGTWRAIPVAEPGGHGAEVDQAACGGVGVCVGAGYYADAENQGHGLVVTLANGVWTSAEAPLPPNASPDSYQNTLQYADWPVCGSDGTCVLHAEYTDAVDGDQEMLDTYRDGRWTSAEAPLATPGNPDGGGVGVSCGGGVCVAAVEYREPDGSWQMSMDVLADGTWTASALPSLPGSDGNWGLAAALCTTGPACYAFGSSGGQPLVAHWSHGTWTPDAIALPPDASTYPDATMLGAACGTTTCTAAGVYSTDQGERSMIATLYDGAWTVSTPPLPPGAPSGAWEGTGAYPVCTPDDTCTEAGGYYDAVRKIFVPTVLMLANGTWTVEVPPVLPGVTGTASVGTPSCTQDGRCVAAGIITPDHGPQTQFLETRLP